MPYQQVSNVANTDALLENIRDFINDTGDWTIHQDLLSPNAGSPNEGSAAGGRKLVAENGDVLVGLRSTTTGGGANRLYMFDGIPSVTSPNPGSAPFADHLGGNSGIRAGNSSYTSSSFPAERVWQKTGPFPNAYFFTNNPSTYFHLALEEATGRWSHLFFGNLTKFGTWTGGGYYGMTHWATDSISIDVPTDQDHSVPFDASDDTGSGERAWTLHAEIGSVLWLAPHSETVNGVTRGYGRGNARGGFTAPFFAIPQSNFSGLVPLAPVTLYYANVSTTPTAWSLLGQVPDVRIVNMTHLVSAREYAISTDIWMPFPQKTFNGAVDSYSSGVYGFALKKIP